MCRPTLAELPETLISCSQFWRWGYGDGGSLACPRHGQVRHRLKDLGPVCRQATRTRSLSGTSAPPRQVERHKLFNLGLIQNSAGSAQPRPTRCSKEGQDHLGAVCARAKPPTATRRPSGLPGSQEDSQVTGLPTATVGEVTPPSQLPADFRTCARLSAPPGRPGAPLPPPTVSRHAPRRKGRSRQ